MDKSDDKLEDVWQQYEKQLQARREYEKNSLEIFPAGEFVVKSKLLRPILNEDNTVAVPANTKVFINFCSNEHIPLPRIEKDPETNEDRLRVPISCDHFGPTTDNKGEHALVVDVVFNSTTIKLCKGNINLSMLSDAEMDLITALDIASLPQFRMYCVEFAIQNIVVKFKIDIDNNATFLKNLRFKGEGNPRPQRIRKQQQPSARPSALDALRNVADQEDDNFVRPASKRRSHPNTSPSAPISTAKVELIDDSRSVRLSHRLLCVPPLDHRARDSSGPEANDLTPVPLLQYLKAAITRNAEAGAGAGQVLPVPPSHLVVKVVGAAGLRVEDVEVKSNTQDIFIDFSKYNNKKNIVDGKSHCSYESILLRLPFRVAPADTHCNIDREAHSITVTTSVTGYSDFWTRVRGILARGVGLGGLDQIGDGDSEAASMCDAIRSLDREVGKLPELRRAWRLAEREGRRMYLGTEAEEVDAEEEENVVDVGALLGLESEFNDMLFLRRVQ